MNCPVQRVFLAPAGGLLCLLLAAFGCKNPDVLVTRVLSRPNAVCLDSSATVNGAQIELYQQAPESTSELLDCSACASPDHCLLAQTQCRCGPRIESNSRLLFDMIGNPNVPAIAFEDLDPNFKYCIRIIGFDTPTEFPSIADCNCPASDSFNTNQQICALSDAKDPGRGATNIVLKDPHCRGSTLSGFDRCANW